MKQNFCINLGPTSVNTHNCAGTTLLEYAIVAGLIALGLVVVLRTMQQNIVTADQNIATQVAQPYPAPLLGN